MPDETKTAEPHSPNCPCDECWPRPEHLPAPPAELNEHILQFFEWKHLRAELAEISMPFGVLARSLVRTLPRNPERTVALRKLLEAKDAAVRARVAK